MTAASEPSPSQSQTLPPANRRRLIITGLLRAFAVTTVLIAIYYLAPLDRTTHIPGWLSMTVALLALGALTAYQVRATVRAAHPGIRAIEALATTSPLFLLLFSATYFLMAKDSAANFNVHTLTRTDALYFTITVFASVGFGDITATSQTARILVMVQMILDLIVIGLVVRLFLGAVQHARRKTPTRAEQGIGPEPDPDRRRSGFSDRVLEFRDRGALLLEQLLQLLELRLSIGRRPWVPVCCDVTSQLNTGAMQVKDIAELTGTTVRTIRYYHQVGLLAVPPVRDGRRDYDVSHVARVGRVRWLADSGLPLAQISAALSVPRDPARGDEREAVLTDLRATLDLLGERIESLTAQRDRLVTLVATVEGGASLSPMPARAVAFYDALAEAASDETTRTGVRRERDFLELAYLRGDVPPEAELLFAAMDDQALTASLDAFSEALASELSDEDVERIAAAIVARMRDRIGERLPEVAQAIDIRAVRRLMDLFLATGDDRERRLGQAVLTKLLATIEEARQ